MAMMLVFGILLSANAAVASTTVDSLITEDYMGLWYEVYTYNFEPSNDRFCVTEYYRERDNGFISVIVNYVCKTMQLVTLISHACVPYIQYICFFRYIKVKIIRQQMELYTFKMV
jgi:lipocalin